VNTSTSADEYVGWMSQNRSFVRHGALRVVIGGSADSAAKFGRHRDTDAAVVLRLNSKVGPMAKFWQRRKVES